MLGLGFQAQQKHSVPIHLTAASCICAVVTIAYNTKGGWREGRASAPGQRPCAPGPRPCTCSSSAVLVDGEVAAADPKLECASANRARRMVALMSRCTAHRQPCPDSNGLSAHQYGQLGISQYLLQILDLMSCDNLDRNLSASVKGLTPPSGDGGAGKDCIAEILSPDNSYWLRARYRAPKSW